MLNETESDNHCRESGSECGLFCAVAWGEDEVVSKCSKLSGFDEKLCESQGLEEGCSENLQMLIFFLHLLSY